MRVGVGYVEREDGHPRRGERVTDSPVLAECTGVTGQILRCGTTPSDGLGQILVGDQARATHAVADEGNRFRSGKRPQRVGEGAERLLDRRNPTRIDSQRVKERWLSARNNLRWLLVKDAALENVIKRLSIVAEIAANPQSGVERYNRDSIRGCEIANQMARRVANMVEPDAMTEAALGPLASNETRLAVKRADSRPQALALVLMAPEFQRR